MKEAAGITYNYYKFIVMVLWWYCDADPGILYMEERLQKVLSVCGWI